MKASHISSAVDGAQAEDAASDLFVQRLYGEWAPADQAAFEARLAADRDFADAYRRVEESWAALDRHAEAPEVMAHRENSIADFRRTHMRRWGLARGISRWRMVAVFVGLVVTLGVVWQLSPYAYVPGQHSTGIGEQRTFELPDHSRVTLDSSTRMRVRYSEDARVVQLLGGQAQFSVAKDVTRPFKVQAGDRIIMALGTVFTVDYSDEEVSVAMLEGRVAVFTTRSARNPQSLEAGESFKIDRAGRTTLIAKADLDAATAWRSGKIILRTETLRDAIRRVNRYSRVQLEITDEALATWRISGVFEAGDSKGFIDALELYLPVVAEYSGSDTVRLRASVLNHK